MVGWPHTDPPIRRAQSPMQTSGSPSLGRRMKGTRTLSCKLIFFFYWEMGEKIISGKGNIVWRGLRQLCGNTRQLERASSLSLSPDGEMEARLTFNNGFTFPAIIFARFFIQGVFLALGGWVSRTCFWFRFRFVWDWVRFVFKYCLRILRKFEWNF